MTEPGLDPIASVEVATPSFALPRPLELGTMRIAEREFAVVRVTTRDGLVGVAYVLSRGEAVVETVQRSLAPLLVGRDADAIARRVAECRAAVPAPLRVGVHTKSLSLIEIALWDVKARRAGLPLWRLLGGHHEALPALVVGGYLCNGQDPEELAERIGALGHDGVELVKLARCPTPELTRTLVDASRQALPDTTELVVDAAWAWDTAGPARRELKRWGDPALAWLEDPFVPARLGAFRLLRERAAVPLAAGDEVTDPALMHRLIDARAIDVARVDATSLGGIAALRDVAAAATAAGIEVSPHAYPEIHIHCAAAWPGFRAVELFDPEGDVFPTGRFISGGPVLRHGQLHAPTTPGLGIELDWETVVHHATRKAEVHAP